MRRLPVRDWSLGFGVLAVAAAMLCSGCGGTPAGPTAGLSVYVDGERVLHASAEELARRPADYRRGGLRGWHVLGTLAPGVGRDAIGSLRVVGTDGEELTIRRPTASRPDQDAVLYVDREGDLRFAMVRAHPRTGVAHGRGPGDGRGPRVGEGRGRADGAPPRGPRHGGAAAPALRGVTEIHVDRRVGTAREAVEAEAPARGEVALIVDGTARTLSFRELTDGVASRPLPDRPGREAWPLLPVLERRTGGTTGHVTVVGREGASWEIPASFLREPDRVQLRINRVGTLKIESVGADGRRETHVRDVEAIAVSHG